MLAEALTSGDLNFVRLVECRRLDGPIATEILVVETEVELGQYPVHDIRPSEPIAFVFPTDDGLPAVLSLRRDFPSVSHLNIQVEEGPRSLCLYDLPWSEVKRQWTPRGMIERTREWLALTARATLHPADQPLEPFLLGSYDSIVIPAEAVMERSIPLLLRAVDAGQGRRVLVTHSLTEEPSNRECEYAVAAPFASTPRAHGVIVRNPETLAALHQFFADAGDDLLGDLRRLLLQTRKELHCHPDFTHILSSRLILIAVLPKTRTRGAGVEAIEFRAFLCGSSVWDVGIEIGIWDRGTRNFGPNLLYRTDSTKQGQGVPVTLLEVMFQLSPELAAKYNNLPEPDNRRITQVGVGALGSQLFMNLARQGWGTWDLIDDDYLLPHNLARHAATGADLGRPKAWAMADLANSIISGPKIAHGIVANALDLANEDVASTFAEAEVILDASASIVVARHLAGSVCSSARRMSIFLNPSGTDAVLLAEDRARNIPLDLLEMQYYRALITDPALSCHLRREGEAVRYGGTCRDVSVRLPQEMVGLHAAMGSRAIRAVVDRDEAAIEIWQTDPARRNVSSIAVIPYSLIDVVGLNWTLRTDQWLLERVADLRSDRLPNETGGILIGSFDVERRMVYVIDVLSAPPDSQEWPHLFIRGRSGLPQQIANVQSLTDGMLNYVGEWHSHPDGHNCTASSLDHEAFASLADVLRSDALPPLMLIVGQDNISRWYLEQMPNEVELDEMRMEGHRD